MKKFLLIFAMCVMAKNYAFAAEERVVTIEILGLHSHAGKVNVAIFNRDDGFPSDSTRALKQLSLPITENNTASIKVSLPEGQYAVATYHDENGDGKLNKNLFGIPTEGIGFSADPKVKLSAPKFDECKVLINGESPLINIHIHY